MNINSDNKLPENFISRVIEVSTALTIIFFIIFSIIKRFGDNQKLYFIPVILFLANFLILVELLYKIKRRKMVSKKKQIGNIVFQLVLNLCFIILVLTYLL